MVRGAAARGEIDSQGDFVPESSFLVAQFHYLRKVWRESIG